MPEGWRSSERVGNTSTNLRVPSAGINFTKFSLRQHTNLLNCMFTWNACQKVYRLGEWKGDIKIEQFHMNLFWHAKSMQYYVHVCNHSQINEHGMRQLNKKFQYDQDICNEQFGAPKCARSSRVLAVFELLTLLSVREGTGSIVNYMLAVARSSFWSNSL